MTPNPAEGSVSREHDPKKKRKKRSKNRATSLSSKKEISSVD
jgi:hypothetical protein